jgi:hypothetical protein
MEIGPAHSVMPRTGILAAMLSMVLVSCSSLPPNALRESRPGILQREFEQTHDPPTDAEHTRCETPYANDTGVTEIAIERTSCYGFCPTYTLRLFSDGRVEYTGQASVRFVGTRNGKVDEYFFTQLARVAVGIGFFELQDRYTCAVTDNPTVYVAVVQNGRRKVIEHYAPEWNGPSALRLFEDAIDGVQRYVEWSAKESPRHRRSRRLLREGPLPDLPRRLIARDEHAARGDLGIDEFPPCGGRVVGKEALAGADGDREGPEVHPVDEAVPEEGVNEVAAAVHPQVRRVILLEGSELRDDVSGDERGILPGQAPSANGTRRTSAFR